MRPGKTKKLLQSGLNENFGTIVAVKVLHTDGTEMILEKPYTVRYTSTSVMFMAEDGSGISIDFLDVQWVRRKYGKTRIVVSDPNYREFIVFFKGKS